MSANDTSVSVTLDQFIALNDELTALVKAGVPLERGLIDAGRELRGRLGQIARELGLRMSEGIALPEALSMVGSGIPGVYRAVVEAGLRSGRLSQALEEMASIARGYADARRSLGIALLYPMIVLGLAYSLALLFVLQIAPRFLQAFDALGLPRSQTLTLLTEIGETAPYWALVPPALFILLAVRWAVSGRALVLDTGSMGPILNRIPLVGAMIQQFRASNFAELLSLLVEHGVPLEQGIRLAGEASGSPTFCRHARQIADSIRHGELLDANWSTKDLAIPPLLRWMLRSSRRQAGLVTSLKLASAMYRRKAMSRTEVLKSVLPQGCRCLAGCPTLPTQTE